MSLDYVFLAQVAGHRFADISNVDDPDGGNPGLGNLRLGGNRRGWLPLALSAALAL